MNLIAAADRNWGIGKDGGQPFSLREDLRRFRALTMGKCVILGRRTLEALPGGLPLPGRRNLVLSRQADFAPEGAEVFRSAADVLAAAPEDAFVIGGGSVYRTLLPHCGRAYVTRLEGAWETDVRMPDLDRDPEWTVEDASPVMEENGVRFRFVTYRRVT